MTSLTTSTAADGAEAPPPARPPGRAERAERPSTREQRQQGDVFDGLLRRKSEEQDGGAAEGGDETALPTVLTVLGGWLPAPPISAPTPVPTAMPAPAAAEGAEPPAPATFEAETTPHAGAAPEPAAGNDATAWQVTLNDPHGLAVELRVSRPAGCGAESAPWALTIGTGAKDVSLLAQHASRLNERLRTRAVALSHLRIESDDEPLHSD